MGNRNVQQPPVGFRMVFGSPADSLDVYKCAHCGATLLKGHGLEKSLIEIKCKRCSRLVRIEKSMLQ